MPTTYHHRPRIEHEEPPAMTQPPQQPPMTPGVPAAPAGTTPTGKRPWVARHKIATALLALLGVGILGSLFGDDEPDTASKVAASSSTSTTSAAPVVTAVEASPTEATSTTTTTTEAPPPVAKPVAYRGRGNKVLKIRKPESGTVLATITGTGGGNFVVYALLDGNKEGDLLVNEIGSYKGTVLLDDDDTETAKLKVESDGRWTITLKPLAAAREITSTAKGSGPDVLIWRGGAATVTFASKGDGNVMLDWIGDDGSESLVNEIGRYSGESPISSGPGVLRIEDAGRWTMQVVED